MSNSSLSISFIVPVFNAEDSVVETLESIVGLNNDSQKEIWIVDDGSTDGSLQAVRRWLDTFDGRDGRIRAELICADHGGEAAAMNAGLAKASHPIVAWVESDVKVDPEWLNYLLMELKKEGVAGAGGLLLPAEADSAIAKIFGYEIAYKIQSNSADALHITSANALYHRRIFEALGPCRVDLGESSFDSELNHRIRKAGYKLRCNPKALAWHRFKTRLGDCMKRTWWYGFRRPFVESLVLYPFDRIVAAFVLFAGLIFPAIGLLWLTPILSLVIFGVVLVSQIGYSLFLYSQFRDFCLLWSSPVFLSRNLIFLIAYSFGLVYKWISPKTD